MGSDRKSKTHRDFVVFVDNADMVTGRLFEYIYHRISNFKSCRAIVYSSRVISNVSAEIIQREITVADLVMLNESESHQFVRKCLRDVTSDAKNIDEIFGQRCAQCHRWKNWTRSSLGRINTGLFA